MKEDPSKPFTYLMDLSMLGVGVGFDTKGAGTITVKGPDRSLPVQTFAIPDSREGWVESLKVLLDSYFRGTAPVQFDYSLVRPAGQPIKGFGGVASGPTSLKRLHEEVTEVLERKGPITVTTIVDIMNYIGKCVVAGNVSF
jgi:ribonucleoside-triphosphate reductase